MHTLGDTTKTIFLKGAENHKLHHEFEVDAVAGVKKGQMVKLTAAGAIEALAAADNEDLLIGVCIHDAADNELCTVATRGYVIVRAESGAAIAAAGPVQAGTFDATNLVNEFITSTGHDKTVGWALETAAAANEEIRVLIKD